MISRNGELQSLTGQPKAKTAQVDIQAMGLEDTLEAGITQTEAAERMMRNMRKMANYKTPLQKFDEEVRAGLGIKMPLFI